jgi:esterase FrsA
MMSLPELTKRLMVTACAMTHTTERATHRFGPAPFLPKLFADRFTHLGGIDGELFRAQLAGCRSFEDTRWAGYWQGFADEQLARADAALTRLGGPRAQQLADPGAATDVRGLGDLLAPAVTILADRGPVADPGAVQRFCAEHPPAADAAVALDSLIKAMVYEFVAAWPGWSPRRLQAYERSHRLCELMLTALAPAMGVTVETVQIPVGDNDGVRGYLILPRGATAVPAVLVSNGIEGTLAEATLPMLKYRTEGIGMFMMEMPGTYSYREPLSAASETFYSTVIDYLTADPRIDAGRIGMIGFSFGGYWSTRMAAVDHRLRVAVANGAPAHRSFGALNSVGMPEIMVSTFRDTTAATSMTELSRKMTKLSLAQHYRNIPIPLLVINGAHDTLISTQDSIDIAIGAPHAQLVLYEGDDHCAMGHAEQWSELSMRFVRSHLDVRNAVDAATR